MKKRLITLLLVLVLAFAVIIPALAATSAPTSGSLNNFKVRNTYASGQYGDVDGGAWYAIAVQACYEYGLMNGVSGGAFLPGGTVTVAEAIKLADCLGCICQTGKAPASYGTPWYKVYVDDAMNKGIIASRPSDASAPVTRAQFAEMISKALPASVLPVINQVTDNAIPDVMVSDSFGAAVYTLYRAGVLTGSDIYGAFRPFDTLTRAEASAIIARAADVGFRKSVTLPRELTGKELYEKCAPAVFYLERYDTEGVLIGIGSGFFITRDGLAVTNYHVIDGAASARITTADGKTYPVKGLCGYDKTTDIALLQIDGSGFAYLDIADSDALDVGTQIFTIGSPYGLLNTISDGIVSNVEQTLKGSSFIQFSAPISMGSGGGPVLNVMGQVVGVSCLTVLSGQTLNFAVPINALAGLAQTDAVTLISIIAKNAETTVYFKGRAPVPDYGVYIGTPLYKFSEDEQQNLKRYYYRLSDITAPDEIAVGGYKDLLKEKGFEWQFTYANGAGKDVDVFYNPTYGMTVHFGIDDYFGVDCRFIAIY
jgi:S1-C subfamily serine protease